MRIWRKLVAGLLSLPRVAKILILIAADATAAALSLLCVRLLVGPNPNLALDARALAALGSAMVTVVAACAVLGAYQSVTRYTDTRALSRVALAAVASGASLLALGAVLGVLAATWNLVVVYTLLCALFLGAWRVIAARALGGTQGQFCGEGVAIYGAGSAGQQLAAALHRGLEYRPIAFIDDRADFIGRYLHGLKVHAPSEVGRLKAKGIKRVLLAMPSVSRSRRKSILKGLEKEAIKVMVMPGIDELADGRTRVDELREVQIEDLLGRDPVPPVADLLGRHISNQCVLVTGAGGSIGSELSRQARSLEPIKLILLESSEIGLYQIERELRAMPEAGEIEIVPVLGSVLDQRLLRSLFKEHVVDTVYHSAAYKHVPLVEANCCAAVQNNVLGTQYTAEIALEQGVQHFVLISTDKAVRPTNVMGASKRVCELVVQGLAQKYPDRTVCMVRFGNVLGSSGSVVPLFKEQIRKGGPVTVTHPDVTRFFMTIPEAAQLVIQAGAMGTNGEVFVLDMGKPVKIRQLAERMIHLCGLTAREQTDPPESGDIEIRYTGLRSGEKLYEELLIGNAPERTAHKRIFKANEHALRPADLDEVLAQLRTAIEWRNDFGVTEQLEKVVDGYQRSASTLKQLPPETSETPAHNIA